MENKEDQSCRETLIPRVAETLLANRRHCGWCKGRGYVTQNYDEYGISDPKDVPCSVCITTKHAADQLTLLLHAQARVGRRDGLLNRAGREQFDRAEAAEAKLARVEAERDAAERQCADAERFANSEGLRADAAEALLASQVQERTRTKERTPDASR
jgi:hypothetical protein